MVSIKVDNAESGDVFTIVLGEEEFSVLHFKNALAHYSGIAPNDQILLIGPPPYRIIDVQFETYSQDDDRRIFLYNRRIFTEANLSATDIRLKPYELPDVDTTVGSISTSSRFQPLEMSSSPLLRTLPDYDKHFLQQLKRGEVYERTSAQAYDSCKKCAEQAVVQLDALDAAASNLENHYSVTLATFTAAKERLVKQQAHHASLLESFESTLTRLGTIPLHPSLRSVALRYGQDVSTLLDTLPIAKERAWAEQCRVAHAKVEDNMAQLQLYFDKVAREMESLDIKPKMSVDELHVLVAKIGEEEQLQADALSTLRASYRDTVARISTFLDYDSNVSSSSASVSGAAPVVSNEEALVKALSDLEGGRIKQDASVLQPMRDRCIAIMKQKDQLALMKNAFTSEIFGIMRRVSAIQTEIQYKLKKGLELMRKWRKGHNGYFLHLEHVESLPQAYLSFLREVMRRRMYGQEFQELVAAVTEEVTSFREAETERRERFMNAAGAHLPPLFFTMVPSLRDKPPFVNITITEDQWVPEIQPADISSLIASSPDIYTNTPALLPEIDTVRPSGSVAFSVGGESVYRRELRFDLEKQASGGGSGELSTSQQSIDVMSLRRENEELKKRLAELTSGVSSADSSAKMEERPSAVETSHESVQAVSQSNVDYLPADHDNTISDVLNLLESASGVLQRVREIIAREADDDLINKITKGAEAEIESKSTEGSTGVTTLLDVNSRLNEEISQITSILQTHLVSEKSGEPMLPSSAMMSASAPLSPTSGSLKQDTPSRRLEDEMRTITITDFKVGDVALFMPTKFGAFVAFSTCSPNRYLAPEVLVNCRTASGKPPEYVIGKIIMINTMLSSGTPIKLGLGDGALNLQEGTEYHILFVEPYAPRRSKSRSSSSS